MISVQQLKQGVSTYTGTISFTVPIASLADTGGKQYLFQAAYNSNVASVVAADNYGQPTSVLGLGWSLDFERIIAVKDWSSITPAIRYYYIANGGMNEMALTATAGNIQTYQLKGIRQWLITYNQSTDYWTVTKEDGVKYTFGDPSGNGAGVVRDVAWGAWMGFSAVTSGQASQSAGWHLTAITDQWKNTVSFSYEQVTVPVGASGLAFTRAIYLSSITGVTGQTAIFTYQEKATNEYGDPALPASGVNAWQYQFETRYLDSVTTNDPGGNTLMTVSFSYDNGSGGTLYIGTGAKAKRCLTGITRKFSGKYAMPQTMFSYITDTASPSLGSLASVTNEDGGIVEYTYQTITSTLSERKYNLTPPVKAGVTYGTPRFWFQNRTLLTTWLGSDNNAAASAYRWEGSWIKQDLCTFPSANAAAYGAIVPALSDTCIGIAASGTLYAFALDVRMPGNWVGNAAGMTLDLTANEPVLTAAGRNFIAILGTTSGKLNIAWFNGVQWQLLPAQQLEAGGTGIVCALGAADNYLAAATSSSLSPSQVNVTMKYMDDTGTWNTAQYSYASGTALITTLSMYAQPAFLCAGATGPAGPNRTTTYTAVMWDAGYGTLASATLFNATYVPASAPPPAVVTNSSIAVGQSLYRFDGAQWNFADLSAITYANTQSVTALSQGYDIVLRQLATKTSGVAFDLLQYDPANTAATGRWSAPSNMANVPAAAGTAPLLCAAANAARDNYVVFNSAIYYRGPNGQFSNLLTIPDSLTQQEAASLSLRVSNYVIYQAGANTCVYMLANGGIAGAKISLAGQQIVPPANYQTNMAGNHAFITYSGTWNPAAGTLPTFSLYSASCGGVQGTVSAQCVKNVTVYPLSKSGAQPYGVSTSAYWFDPATAVIRPDGWAVAFNKAIVAEGTSQIDPASAATTKMGTRENYYFNNLPAGITPSEPYPQDAQNTNAATALSLISGMLYRSKTLRYKADDQPLALIASETQYLWVYQQTVGTVAQGYYQRILKQDQMLDNVTWSTASAYYSETAQLKSVTTSHYDATGAQETMVESYTYWWQQYDPTRSLNFLSPVIRKDSTTNGNVTGISITTWKNAWHVTNSNWAEWGTYAATSATPATFNQWNNDTTPLASGWILREKVVARNSRGLPVAEQDTIGREISLLWDTGNNYRVASFQNASTAGQEAAYYGFEPYETNTSWSYLGGSIGGNIVTGEAHTGSRSLAIPSNTGSLAGPTATFIPATQNRRYLFSAWVQTPPGFGTAPGTAQWKISLYTTGASPAPVGSDILVPFPATNGMWQYLFTVIDLGKIRSDNNIPPATLLSITILGYNQKTGLTIAPMVDNLRFSPLDAVFSATVYEAGTYLTTARLGENGATEQIVRDVYQRETGLVGPGQEVARITINTLARTISADGMLNPSFPNSRTDITAAATGGYYNFEASDADQWNLPTGWQMQLGSLTFTGTGAPPLGSVASLKSFGHTSFAAYVKVSVPSGLATPNTGIGANNVYVYWNQGTARWNVCYLSGGQPMTVLSKLGPGYRNDMALVIIDSLLTFYADGVEVFSYTLPDGIRPDGSFFLSLTGNASFSDLLIAAEPRLALSVVDGAGNSLQSLALQNGTTLVAGGAVAGTDTNGVPIYGKNPFFRPVKVTNDLVNGGVGTYLPDNPDGGGQMTLSQYLAPSGGFLYSQKVNEPSPLQRVLADGAPGTNYAIPSGNVMRYGYKQNSATGPMKGIVPDNVAGNYFLYNTEDQNGVFKYSLLNTAGQLIAERRVMEGANVTLTTGYVYSGQGQLLERRPPNYYNPPANTQSAVWITSMQYDFNEHLTQSTSPDSGTTKYKYDSVGRCRFILDANGAAQTPARIIYSKYDALNRETEKGFIQQTAVTWASLDTHLDDQSWPSAADGAKWNTRVTFDYAGADAQNPLYSNMDLSMLAGRVWKSEFNVSGDGSVVNAESFSYDLGGSITMRTTTPAGYGTSSYQSQFAYNNLGETVQVTYPRILGTDGKPVGNANTGVSTYNRLGQLINVGTTQDAAAYATYTYTPWGDVASEQLKATGGRTISRAYQYTDAGWPASASGDFMLESMQYDDGGYCGAKYYNGKAASVSSSCASQYIPGNANDPFFTQTYSSMGWKYKYDNAGRLQAAEYSSDAQDRSYSIGVEPGVVTYDPNGNFLTVPRGEAVENYSYADGSGTGMQNRVSQVSTPFTVNAAFTGTAQPGWTWGASNMGPSLSGIVDSGGTGGTPPSSKAFKLCGGGVAHYEYLQYAGYLDPRGTNYTFSYWFKTDPGFNQQAGTVTWRLQLCNGAGVLAEKDVASLGAGSDSWTQTAAVTLDLSSMISGLGLAETAVSFRLTLTNNKRGTDGAAGAAAYVTSVSLSGSGAAGRYTYDANGNITASPAKNIGSIGFNPVSGLPSAITITGPRAAALAFNYYATGAQATESLTAAGQTTKKLHLYDNAGNILATYINDGSGESSIINIQGASGILAQQTGASTRYFLKDRLGSNSMIVDQNTQVLGTYRYGPFGELVVQPLQPVSDILYTGQAYSKWTELYDYKARLYDASLRRFYSTDVQYQFPAPYAYTMDDPINHIDPDGQWGLPSLRTTAKVAGVLGAAGAVPLSFIGGIIHDQYQRTPAGSLPSGIKQWGAFSVNSLLGAFESSAEQWANVPYQVETGQGIYTPEEKARLLRCASAFGLDPLTVKMQSQIEDFARGRTYNPANFAYARQLKSMDGRIAVNGTHTGYTGGVIYTLDENFELRVHDTITGSDCNGHAVSGYIQLMAHSQLGGGKQVYSAGWMWLENGTVRRVNTGSGHYVPPSAGLYMVQEVLKTLGMNVSTMDVCDFDQELIPNGKCTFTPGKRVNVERGKLRLDENIKAHFYNEPLAARTRLQAMVYNNFGFNLATRPFFWLTAGNNGCVLEKPYEMMERGLPY